MVRVGVGVRLRLRLRVLSIVLDSVNLEDEQQQEVLE